MIKLQEIKMVSVFGKNQENVVFEYVVGGLPVEVATIKDLVQAAAKVARTTPAFIDVEIWGDWYNDIDYKEFPEISLHVQSYQPLTVYNLAYTKKWLDVRYQDHEGEHAHKVTTEGLKGIRLTALII